jgi:hypothetical protein
VYHTKSSASDLPSFECSAEVFALVPSNLIKPSHLITSILLWTSRMSSPLCALAAGCIIPVGATLAARVPDTAQRIDWKSFNVLESVPPPAVANDSTVCNFRYRVAGYTLLTCNLDFCVAWGNGRVSPGQALPRLRRRVLGCHWPRTLANPDCDVRYRSHLPRGCRVAPS